MSKEELIKAMRDVEEKTQNESIDKLHDMVKHLLEKSNKKGYVPTEHERETFNDIRTIINNMNNWF